MEAVDTIVLVAQVALAAVEQVAQMLALLVMVRLTQAAEAARLVWMQVVLPEPVEVVGQVLLSSATQGRNVVQEVLLLHQVATQSTPLHHPVHTRLKEK